MTSIPVKGSESIMGTSTAAPERHHCRRPLREEWELDEGEGRGGGGGETVSKTTIAAKTVENGEDSDDGAKLCLDERGRVHAKGNAKLEYASKSSILFNFSSSEQIQKEYFRLLRDCKKVFTAKQTLETESYSAGSTFWISAAAATTAKEEKREENKKRKMNNEGKKVSLLRSSSKLSGLERLALRVFEHVTQHLKEGEEYDSNTSGAEWWTQVIDPRDDIGAHFDKDYYLEENMNISVHPQVGTVTYLSDEGAPTVVATSVVCQTYFDNSNPIDTNDMLINETTVSKKDDKTEDSVYISWPKIGKITTFDGRCLHAAPSALSGYPEEESEVEEHDDDDDDDKNNIDTKRITFLVNVWLNHKPVMSENLPEEVRETLEFGQADFDYLFLEKRQERVDEKTREGTSKDKKTEEESTKRRTKLTFTHCQENLVYEYSVPEFCFESSAHASARRLGQSLLVSSSGVLRHDAPI